MFFDCRKEDSYIDYNVFCINSEVQVKLEDYKIVIVGLFVENVNQLIIELVIGFFFEIQLFLRDFEEEVDVVGDSSVLKEQCNENINNVLDISFENMLVFGELELFFVLDCVLV